MQIAILNFDFKMNLKVKSHILTKHFISKIALNKQHHILAVVVDSADTVAFYHLTSQQPPQEIFQGMSKPTGKKSSMAWSHDGTYLALGSNNLELWKFDGRKMAPVKSFSQDFVDVKIVTWSPDSQMIAYGGLSRKNTIKIKNIQTGGTRDLPIPLTISGISFDPFGKYLLLLLMNNIVYVYNSSNLSKVREVPLSPSADPNQNSNTVKEIRMMGWSPDFHHMVCPSLDDSKVSLALDLSRSGGFKVRQAFLGHVSSISCASFNPNLYEFQGQVTNILALGDSHGVVSLWRVATTIASAPLFIMGSNSDYHQVVDDLQWNQEGETLIMNVMKRYVNILIFDKTKFGRQLTSMQKANIIEESYGVRSATELQQKQLEIFSMASLQEAVPREGKDEERKAAVEGELSAKVGDKGTQGVQIRFGGLLGKVEYVRVNEQVTVLNKNNKKRIQPAMLMRKDQVQKMGTSKLPVPFSSASPMYSTIGSVEPLNMKPISSDLQLIRISRGSILEIRRIQGYSIVRLLKQCEGQRVVVGQRVFTSAVDWIKCVGERIYILNMGNLHIFGLKLELLDLPYSLGDIHRIVVKPDGDLYYISTKGQIRGFNHLTKTCYTPTPVTVQSLLQAVHWKGPQKQKGDEKQAEQFEKVVEDCWVQNNHNFYVSLHQWKCRHFYCRNTQCWITLELNAGLLQEGHSIRIGVQEDILSTNFLNSLTSKFLPQAPNPTQTPLQQFQSNLIYYRIHQPNRQLYLQNLVGLLKELKMRNQLQKFRAEIVKYFVDKSSGCYQSDEGVRARVRQMGGSVVEEFMLFSQL